MMSENMDWMNDINMKKLEKALEIDSYPKFEPRLDVAYNIEILSEISQPFETKNGLARSINLSVEGHGKRHIICNKSFLFSLAKLIKKNELMNYIGLKCVLQKTKMSNSAGQSFQGINLYID